MLHVLASIAVTRYAPHALPGTGASAVGAPRHAPSQLGWLDWLAGEDVQSSPEASEVLREITRPEGWDVSCSIGSDVARSVGGSGLLANGESATVRLDLRLRFALDSGYDPPQGSVSLLQRSSYVNAEQGIWKVDSDTDAGVPDVVQWRLNLPGGLQAGGQELLPAGPIYFNARCQRGDGGDGGGALPRLRLRAGRLTVKEDIGIDTPIFGGKGILAEFKIVGTFETRPVLGT